MPLRRAWAIGTIAIAALVLALVATCERTEPHAPETTPVRAPDPPTRARSRETGSDTPVAGTRAIDETPVATSGAVVRVVTPDGAPVAGAAVDLHRIAIGSAVYEAPVARSGVTGADGIARFAVPRASYFARAKLDDRLGAADACWVPQTPGQKETAFAVVLRTALVHRGRVLVESSDEPISGARVTVQDRGLFRIAVTDADGRFEVAGVAHQQDPLAWADAFGFVAADRTSRSDGDRAIEWTITLARATVLRGVLRGPNGPLPVHSDVSLAIVRDGHETGGVQLSTDDDGRFEATFRGRGRLFVQAAGLAPAPLPVEATGTGVLDAGVIELRDERRLRGRVVDMVGAPVQHVIVGVRHVAWGLGLGLVTTDAAGAFDVGGLDDGEVEVTTNEEPPPPLAGGRPYTSRRGVFAGAELTIVQPEGNAVLVRLRDARDAEVVVRTVIIRMRRPGETAWGTRRFAAQVHTVRVLADAPGTYDLRVEAQGFDAAEVLGVEFPEGRATAIDVRLSPEK